MNLPEPHYNRLSNLMELSVEEWGDVRIAFGRMQDEIAQLREQLRLANIDALLAELEASNDKDT